MALETKAPAYPIGSVDNALRLLLLFREQKSIRIADASEQLGVARSTAHRLMDMLAYHGFVRQDPESRAYVPGGALLDIGLSVVKQLDIRSIARPHLEDLARATNETVHLARLDLPNVLFIDCVESDRAIRVASRVGKAMPAHCTSVGKAMLAACPLAAVKHHFRGRRLAALTPRSITTAGALFAQLVDIRERGYALNAEESEEGLGSVGVAIVDRAGRPVGAISVAAPLQRRPPVDFDKIATLARAAAAHIADQLD
jgi:DNA-binding IclR family transcriptional regulator